MIRQGAQVRVGSSFTPSLLTGETRPEIDALTPRELVIALYQLTPAQESSSNLDQAEAICLQIRERLRTMECLVNPPQPQPERKQPQA